jgi:hypothetical protein
VLQPLHPPAIADTASEAHRHFARLQPYGRAGVRSYLEDQQPHLLRAYTADFLVELIEATKARCHERIAGAIPARLGHDPQPRLAA